MHLRGVLVVAFGLQLVACGGSPEPKQAAAPKPRSTIASQSEAAAADQPEEAVPNRCVQRKNACMPPIKWAEKLCGGVYPDLALYMFREGTPWTRFYLKMGLNAVNGWGPTLDEDMVSREEVLVINHRLTRDSLEVEGSLGTYDVFRWNGSCVTLDVAEVTSKTPSDPKSSRIDFRTLSDEMQQALMRDATVAETHEARRKECKGISVGRVTQRCEELDHELTRVVASYVRSTSELPLPDELP